MDLINSSYTNLTTSGGDIADNVFHTIPLWRQIMWMILFLIIIVIGTTGNLIVLWIIMAHRTMQATVTHLYIANLAIADVMIALINVPLTAFALIFANWPFGLFLCKLNEGVATICICVYVITLFAVSVNRYKVVIAMIKQQDRPQQTGIITIVIWIVSILVASPNWLFATTDERTITGGVDGLKCGPVWSNKTLEIWYFWIYLIASYLLPLTLMTYTYGRISFKLWRSSIGGGAQNHNQNVKDQAEKKIIKMMVVVALMFAICWFPFRGYTIFGSSEMADQASYYMNDIYLLIFWIAMSNCMYNPFIYYWMSAEFRTGFRIAFMWCPLITYKWDSEEEEC